LIPNCTKITDLLLLLQVKSILPLISQSFTVIPAKSIETGLLQIGCPFHHASNKANAQEGY